MSPSMAIPGSGGSGRPRGSSSSIGKLITSVGPGRSIQRMWRSAIAAVSSRTIESSADGCTFILRMTNRATLISSSSETSMPDSLDTSMLMVVPLPPGPAGGTRRRRPSRSGGAPLRPVHECGLLRLGIRVHDLGDQPVPHHVGACQLGEVNIVDAVEDPHRGTQAGIRPAGEVDLRDIAGHNDFGVEP